jgi:hypothetical protein
VPRCCSLFRSVLHHITPCHLAALPLHHITSHRVPWRPFPYTTSRHTVSLGGPSLTPHHVVSYLAVSNQAGPGNRVKKIERLKKILRETPSFQRIECVAVELPPAQRGTFPSPHPTRRWVWAVRSFARVEAQLTCQFDKDTAALLTCPFDKDTAALLTCPFDKDTAAFSLLQCGVGRARGRPPLPCPMDTDVCFTGIIADEVTLCISDLFHVLRSLF